MSTVNVDSLAGPWFTATYHSPLQEVTTDDIVGTLCGDGDAVIFKKVNFFFLATCHAECVSQRHITASYLDDACYVWYKVHFALLVSAH